MMIMMKMLASTIKISVLNGYMRAGDSTVRLLFESYSMQHILMSFQASCQTTK